MKGVDGYYWNALWIFKQWVQIRFLDLKRRIVLDLNIRFLYVLALHYLICFQIFRSE